MRDRVDAIAEVLTLEQGKPLAEAKAEIVGSAEVIEWFAEEGRRAYGRIIPSRHGVRDMVIPEPVGVVAGFSPWNFPATQAVRKIAAPLGRRLLDHRQVPGGDARFADRRGALLPRRRRAAGRAQPRLRRALRDLRVPDPASDHPQDLVHRLGAGRQAPELRSPALHMKRATMELGGHSPMLIFDDVDVASVAKLTGAMKWRNAGQVCISPTRFFVHDKVYDKFVAEFTDIAKKMKVGDGMDPDAMGPLANPRRINAMQTLIQDAQEKGAKVATGGNRIGNQGNFLEPTVLTDVPNTARIMNEEPFGPVAVMLRFKDTDEMLTEANRLPFGLASYVFTHNTKLATKAADALEAGMVSINHHGIALPETPFGGVKDSGFGHEGGIEGLSAYMQSKFVSHLG